MTTEGNVLTQSSGNNRSRFLSLDQTAGAKGGDIDFAMAQSEVEGHVTQPDDAKTLALPQYSDECCYDSRCTREASVASDLIFSGALE